MRNKKSKVLLVVSRLVGFGGVFACMLAAIVYLLGQVNGSNDTPVDLGALYIIAVLAVVCVVVGVALRIASHRAAKAESDDLDISEVVEDAVDEILDSYDEAVDTIGETVGEAVEEVEDAVVDAAQASKFLLTPERKEKIVKAVKKNAPVVLAVVATAAVSVALHNSAKEKQKARVRKNILDLLY
jgi:ABC-type proline/glycine betaine transport system permease subunit